MTEAEHVAVELWRLFGLDEYYVMFLSTRRNSR